MATFTSLISMLSYIVSGSGRLGHECSDGEIDIGPGTRVHTPAGVVRVHFASRSRIVFRFGKNPLGTLCIDRVRTCLLKPTRPATI